MKNPCEARKIKDSQNLHKIISTHILTVLTIRVILRTEQRKRKKKSSSSFDENDNSTQECSQYKEESVMLMPSIFGENLFDDWFDEFPFYDMDKEMNNTEKKLYGKKAGRIMKTDIKEQKDGYELMIDLPGFTKDEIKASVEDGYLTISAAKGLDKDEKEKDSGHYIRRERYAGACQRSFYVGEDIEQEDVKAEFKHGILKLFVPKKEAKKAVEENKYIAIEG